MPVKKVSSELVFTVAYAERVHKLEHPSGASLLDTRYVCVRGHREHGYSDQTTKDQNTLDFHLRSPCCACLYTRQYESFSVPTIPSPYAGVSRLWQPPPTIHPLSAGLQAWPVQQ